MVRPDEGWRRSVSSVSPHVATPGDRWARSAHRRLGGGQRSPGSSRHEIRGRSRLLTGCSSLDPLALPSVDVPLTGRQGLLPRVGDEHLQDRPMHAVTAPTPLGRRSHPSWQRCGRDQVAMYPRTAVMTSGHGRIIASSPGPRGHAAS